MLNTNCTCTNPGWCERHQCHKTPHLFQLCRRSTAFFKLWEAGSGPGQDAIGPEEAEPAGGRAPPGIVQRAMSLGAAVVNHVRDGLQQVDEPAYQARLDVCRGCPSFEAKSLVCEECHCFLAVKARWRSSKCPLAKWTQPAAESP